MRSASEFDRIAQEVYFPIYPVIAKDIVADTGISTGHFLDIGCGGGHLGLNLLKITDMTGVFIDLKPDAIEIARKRAEQWQLSGRAEFLEGDVHALPLKDESVDLVISRGSAGFWQDEKKAFSEIYRVLSPGGKTYIGWGLGNPALKVQIAEKMKIYNPEWPGCLKKVKNGWTSADYDKMLTELSLPHHIEESDEKGVWIIVEKVKVPCPA